MARQVTGSLGQYLNVDTGTTLTYPFTLSCRFKVDVVPSSVRVVMLYGEWYPTPDGQYCEVGSDRFMANTAKAGSYLGGIWMSAPVVGQWYLWVGVFNGSGSTDVSRRVYVDNSTQTALESTSLSAASHASKLITLGGLMLTAGDFYETAGFDGYIADAAIWDVALTDADVDALAASRPGNVKSANLKAWYKLGEDGGLTSSVGTYPAMTVVGSCPIADDPPYLVTGTGDIKTINSLAIASVKTFLDVPRASIKTINALSVGADAEPVPPIPTEGLGVWYKSDGEVYSTLAAQFTAANSECLSAANNPSLQLGNIDWTIGTWALFDDIGLHHMLITKRDGVPCEYVLYSDPSTGANLLVDRGAVPVTVAAPGLTAGVWHFIVGWHDVVAGTLNLQVNGGTVVSVPTGGAINVTTDRFWLGAQATATGGPAVNHHNGRMQNAFIFGRGLTATERSFLYNSGSGRRYEELNATFKTNLRAWWDLSEASGSRYDRSGNNNTLTDNNTVTALNPGAVLNIPGNGGGVYVWQDSGPNNLKMDATGAAPAYIVNGQNNLPVVRFPGAVAKMVTAPVLGSKLCGYDVQTVFVVQKQFAAQGETTYSWDSSGGFTNETAAHLKHSNHTLYFINGSALGTGLSYGLAPEPWVGLWHLVEMSRNGSAASIVADDVPLVGLAQATTGFDGSPSVPLYLGARGAAGASEFLNGDLAELIIYNRYLSTEERTTVRNYLHEKWFALSEPDGIAGLKVWYKSDEGVYSRSAAQFVAANSEALTIPSNTSLQLGNIPWAFGGWFYLDSLTSPAVFLGKGLTTNEYILYAHSPGTILIVNSVEAIATPPSLNAWHFVVGSYDSTTGLISVQLDNGALFTANAGVPLVTADALAAGKAVNDTLFMNGRLQNWFIFGRGLNATERSFLYNSGNGRSYEELDAAFKTGLRAWWPLDETNGTRRDKHVNANHLTDVNTVGVVDGIVKNPASNGSMIYQWNDLSESVANAQSLGIAVRPLWLTGGANGKPAVRFDGIDDLLATGPWAAPGLYTCFIVSHHFPIVATYRIGLAAVNSATDQQAHFMGLEPSGIMRATTWDVADTAFVETVAGDAGVVHQEKVIRAASSIELFRNGVSDGPLATTGTPRSGMYSIKIGHNYSLPIYGYPWAGDMYEIIIYDRVLTPAEQAQVEAYLLAKYGV